MTTLHVIQRHVPEGSTVLIQRHVPEGSIVWNGYTNQTSTAPSEKGLYTLYEVADENNCHVGWKWQKEGEQG